MFLYTCQTYVTNILDILLMLTDEKYNFMVQDVQILLSLMLYFKNSIKNQIKIN